MNTFSKRVVLIVSMLATVCAAARAEESQWPKRALQFEVRTYPSSAAFPRGSGEPAPPEMPTGIAHVAIVTVGPENAVANLNLPHYRNSAELPSALARMPSGLSISEKQRALLANPDVRIHTVGHNGPGVPNRPSPGNKYVVFKIYAVSEDDARKVAQAFVELCDSKTRANWEEAKKKLENARLLIPETEKKIADIEARLREASAEFDKVRLVATYRSLDAVSGDVVDLDKALRSIQIEMIGIQAKENAIKKLKESNPKSDWLDQMLAREDIELAGVLARKSALESRRKNAETYWTQWLHTDKYQEESTRLKKTLPDLPKRVSELEKLLADPPAHMKPLTVDDKVIICTFKPDAPQTQPTSGVGNSTPAPHK